MKYEGKHKIQRCHDYRNSDKEPVPW